MTWLGVYESITPGVALGDNSPVRLDLDNEPQPDAVLLVEERCGGQAKLSADDYLEGAPEFIAEIAVSSASIDLGDKLRAYRRNGVREYCVWQVCDRKLDWFSLQNGAYVPLPIDGKGIARSIVFPGLWLAVDNLLAWDMASVLAVLQSGLATDEHAAFGRRLPAAL